MLPSPLRFQKGRYVARLAQDKADLQAAQHLRYLVFRDAKGAEHALDVDAFDADCDHILIEDTGSGQLVGCFRMRVFENGSKINLSYAAQLYDLEQLSRYMGALMEIGRFCVAPAAYDADILRMAWATIASHVDEIGVGMLFGCSSFEGTSEELYQDAFALLKDRYLGPTKWAPATKSSLIFPYANVLVDVTPNLRSAMKSMPPLLRTYLAMGGWVSDHAVIDLDLDTMHVFTGVEIASIPPARAKALRALAD